MLIETDTGGEREIGANPYEHSSPMGVLDIEVILIDPTPLHLEMPTIVFPDGGHVGGGLTCFDNGYNLIGLGTLEVALHKVIAPAWGILDRKSGVWEREECVGGAGDGVGGKVEG